MVQFSQSAFKPSLPRILGTCAMIYVVVGIAGCSSSSPADSTGAGADASNRGGKSNATSANGGQGGTARGGVGGRVDQTGGVSTTVGGVSNSSVGLGGASGAGTASSAGGASSLRTTSGGSVGSGGAGTTGGKNAGGAGGATGASLGKAGSVGAGGNVGKGGSGGKVGGAGAGGKKDGSSTVALGGSTSNANASAGNPSSGGNCDDAVQALRDYLKLERSKRPLLADQCFAKLSLTKDQAETARGLLTDDHSAEIRDARAAETTAKSITIDGKTMRYAYTVYGQKPQTGRSLFLSLHGGGEADASVNDEQWENQKQLYQPDEGVYLCPRAPTNTWNLWHEAHIDGMLQRLIEDMIVFQDVNPNRVYVMGYSAGGDGVYQLGPRMADYWAAAAMMAGHPNDAKPDSLRNIGFTIHVGALDTSYDRNLKAQEWGQLLDSLEAADPEGYPHFVQIHANKSHWMDLEDAVAVPWMADFTRNPIPSRVVWLQDDVTHERFYWLRVKAAQALKATRVVAEYQGQSIKLEANGLNSLSIRLSDAMLNLDLPVTISAGGKTLFSAIASRTIGTLAATLQERGDPALVFSAEVELSLP